MYPECLIIKRISALKKIGGEVYGESVASGVVFPSLKSMTLGDARDLEEWSVPERDAFLCLLTLIIWSCPKLRIQLSSILASRIGHLW